MGVEYGQLIQPHGGDRVEGGSVAQLAEGWLAWATANVVTLAVVAAMVAILLLAWRGSSRRMGR
jgi:hypothetical protein